MPRIMRPWSQLECLGTGVKQMIIIIMTIVLLMTLREVTMTCAVAKFRHMPGTLKVTWIQHPVPAIRSRHTIDMLWGKRIQGKGVIVGRSSQSAGACPTALRMALWAWAAFT